MQRPDLGLKSPEPPPPPPRVYKQKQKFDDGRPLLSWSPWAAAHTSPYVKKTKKQQQTTPIKPTKTNKQTRSKVNTCYLTTDPIHF